MGATGATGAVAVAKLKEREVVEDFRRAGAISAATARPLEEIGLAENLTVRRLCKREVIREASPGQFYLDDDVWRQLRAMRRRMALVFLATLALISLGLIFAAATIK